MANCARNSSLMRTWPIEVIPIPLDLELYSPIEKSLARKILNLPLDKNLILFGAIGGIKDPRKGSDLLFKALKILKENNNANLSNLEIIVFGGSKNIQSN